jgi:hypothetical protein
MIVWCIFLSEIASYEFQCAITISTELKLIQATVHFFLRDIALEIGHKQKGDFLKLEMTLSTHVAQQVVMPPVAEPGLRPRGA